MLEAKLGLESTEYDGGFGPAERTVAAYLHAALQEINMLRYLEEIVVDEISNQIKILNEEEYPAEEEQFSDDQNTEAYEQQ